MLQLVAGVVELGVVDHVIELAGLLELARAVVKVTGSSSEIVFEALPVDDPQVRKPDITRARELLGWEPQVGLEEGLGRLLESIKR